MKKRVVLTVLLSMCLLGGCKGKELTDYEKGMEKNSGDSDGGSSSSGPLRMCRKL